MRIITPVAVWVLVCAVNARSATLTVNSTADNLTSDNFLTLREAVVLVDFGGVATNASSLGRPLTAAEQAQISGAFGVNDTIIIPAGTYQLTIVGTGEGLTPALPKIGDLDIVVSGVTVRGAGASNTIIQQTSPQDRVFDVNVNFIGNFVFTLDGVTISGGRETSGVAGGGVFTGSSSGTLGLTTIKNCRFVNNRASGLGTLGGGGWAHQGGHALVTNCVFGGSGPTDTNSTSTSGGAIYFDAFGTTATFTVTNCTFSNNIAGSAAAGGGAIDVAALNLGVGTLNVGGCTFFGNRATNASGGAISDESITMNVTACTFVNNFAAVAGGALFSGGGTGSTVRYSRFLGNNAANSGNGQVIHNNGGVSFTANDNWWGTNSGPTTNDIRNLTATTWLQLRHTANPNTIFIPNSTTLTATFLTNSAGTFIPVANLSRVVGLPITFNNPVRGSLSGAQPTIQSSGTATATFTANVAGAGSVDAVMDNQLTTASITIPTGVSSINRVQTTPTNLASVQWTVTFTNAVTNVTAANFSLVNTGLGGSPGITSVTPVGGPLAASWTVTASTGSGTGTLRLNMVNGSGVSAVIVNLPFTGQAYTIDLIPPDTSITAQPPALTNSASARFSFTGSDTGVGVAGFQCRLDGGTFTNCISPVSFSGLSDASHTFDVRAIDAAGNTDASPASVTWVVDTTPPSISIGPPSSTLTRTGIVSYLVTYADLHFNTSTLAAGNVTLNKTGTANGTILVSGSGTTRTVTITNTTGDGTIAISISAGTASDTVGNSALAAGPGATFTVDHTAPTITCPTNIIVSANAACSATNVTLGSPATSDANGVASVTNNAGTSYPLGTNTVTWTVRDNVGLTNACNQLVIVRDTEPPTMFCSSNITINATGYCPIVVTFSASATDNCGLTNLVVTPGTGSLFPVGTNLVKALAQDAAGNSNTCSFTVTVLAGTPPQLRFALQGTNAVVWWPDLFPCYKLQSTPTLLGSNIWTNYTGALTTNSGSIYVTNGLTTGNRFYRLVY